MSIADKPEGRGVTVSRLFLLCAIFFVSQPAYAAAVSALGRLEPENGVIHVSVKSTAHAVSGSVVTQLLVEEGDWVTEGQLLAETDTTQLARAISVKAEAELELAIQAAQAAESQTDEACTRADVASSEAERRANLLERKLASPEETEQAQGEARSRMASCKAARANERVAKAAIKVAEARIAIDQEEIERSMVRAPVSGRVLEIHTRPGEMAGQQPLLDLGRTEHMFAIAEVYETDISGVSPGQKARISSDALEQVLTGTVEHIRAKVQKIDVIDTDPAARKDARIIEVEIRLDNSEAVADLTNLQVEIIIGD